MAYEALLIDDTDGVRVVTLHRPDALNALNETLKDELNEALKAAEREPTVRCIVLTGAGRAFCAGQDLKDRLAPGSPSLGDTLRQKYNALILRLRTMEKPVIAAVNGVAAGAGCSLALACDIRIAAESASFLQAFVKVGLVPDSGATFLLPRLVGLGKALEMAFTGDPLDAPSALAAGLVNRMVPDDRLMTEGMELARRLAAGPPIGIGLTKRAMNRALTIDLADALDYEADMQEIAGRTEDYREGVAAFMEKRPARFTGR